MSINLTPSSPTYPTVTIQQLKFTARRFGQFPSITYVNGATAGAEVVTVDSSFNITIQISNGVSTNTQIAAAVNAATQGNGLGAGDLCSAAPVAGHETDTPTCYSVALAGGRAAVAASVLIGSLKVTANAAGTGGNAISVVLKGDANLTISTVGLPFTVTTVTDGTHLVVSDTTGMTMGDTIVQGVHSTTITTVTDGTHLVVGDTTAWAGSAAAAVDTSVQQFVCASTAALIAGSPIQQTSHSTTVVSVVSGTVITVASTSGFVAGAATSNVTPGSEVAVEASNVITVQVHPKPSPATLGDTAVYTTPLQLLTVINAIGSVNVLVTFNGRVGKNVSQDQIGTYALAGGLAAVAATTGAVNGLTVNANATGTVANGVTVTLIPGGTAGAEAVVDLANGSFTCQIQSGTSTITQVRTALNADTAFTALYTAVGTSSTAMQAVYQNAMTGAAGPAGNMGFYMDSATTALTTSFQWMPFGNLMGSIHVENNDASGSNTIIGSWDGVNTHFIISANTARDFIGNTKDCIFLKYGTGAPAYRAWAVVR